MPNDASINGISEKGITYKTLVLLYVERIYKQSFKEIPTFYTILVYFKA